MRRRSRYTCVLSTVLFWAGIASAQTALDINMGFGAIQDKASSTQLNQALAPCAGPNDPSGPCISTPALSGFMLGFGGDVMLWKRFGVGAAFTIQPAQQSYVNLNSQAASQGLSTFSLKSRMALYDLNGVYEPIHTERMGVKLRGGFGGANLKFYQNGSTNDSFVGTQNFSQYFASSNHFQVHGGLGLQAYIMDHIFVRPEFEVYYVPNLTQQYGRNLVTEEMVWIGYSWGNK